MSNASALLSAQGLRPRKRWGQNFLCDRNVLDRIVRVASLQPEDRVLEIGAGLGSLTRSLADSAQHVTAVEIDTLLKPILAETLEGRENISLIFEDFLKIDPRQLLTDAFGDRPGIVVANIPYYITTSILERLLNNKDLVKRIVILVQQEFAERLSAKHDTEAFGSMSVFAQYHASVELAFKVPRQVFLPAPEVSSAVVILNTIRNGSVDIPDEKLFFSIVRGAFGKRRKTLHNALSSCEEKSFTKEFVNEFIRAAGIDPGRRGETLALEEFAMLTREAFKLPK